MSPLRYGGRGIGEMKTARGPIVVALPVPEAATALPDPRKAYEDLRGRFLAARGRTPTSSPTRPQPDLTVRDVKRFANHLTHALRNDLPSFDRRDAAVIWEKWRQAVANLRELMRTLEEDAPALNVGDLLLKYVWDSHESLATALEAPGVVFENYCPWRAEWATLQRLRPEDGR